MLRRFMFAALLACGLSLACARAEFGRDAEALHYGSRAATAAAYGYGSDEPPFRRPAPEPWPLGHHPQTGAPESFVFEQAAPPPERELAMPADVVSLCEHTVGLIMLEQGTSDASRRQAGLDACTLLLRTEMIARTSEQRQAVAACVRATERADQVDQCTSTNASPLDQTGGSKRERLVCKHIVAITLLEEIGGEVELSATELDSLVPVVQECVDDLLASQAEDPGAYQALLDCMLASNSSVAFDRCE